MMISKEDKDYLLSLTPEDLTFSTLLSIFGDTAAAGEDISKTKRSRFNTTDEMILLPDEYFVDVRTVTTVGRFIYNKYIVERVGLQGVLGYVNTVLSDSGNSKLESKLSDALVEDRVTIEQFHKYIDYRDTLGLQLHSVITTSFTPATVVAPAEVEKRKEELFAKYDKELNEGNIFVSEQIEKELTASAKEILKGDPGMDLYDSEARGNFGNYKNMNLFKGATMNNQTGKYEIVRSSFMKGIKKEDIPSFGTAVVSGAYPKAVATQDSGYMSKQLLAAMQNTVLDEQGTDCHSKKTIRVLLTDKNKLDFMYRYIVEGGKLICLTPEIMGKYVGKTVNMRSPMYCKNVKKCNVCSGDMSYKLGIKNIGLGCSRIATTLLRMGMKKFHTANIASKLIDVDDMLL